MSRIFPSPIARARAVTPIDFVVDTGATLVSMSEVDAKRLGLDFAASAFDAPEGVWTGPSGGASALAAVHLARELGPGHRVVTGDPEITVTPTKLEIGPGGVSGAGDCGSGGGASAGPWPRFVEYVHE